MERVFGDEVHATVFRMAANERADGYERGLRLLCAFGLVRTMSAAICSLHSVNVDLNAHRPCDLGVALRQGLERRHCVDGLDAAVRRSVCQGAAAPYLIGQPTLSTLNSMR